MGHVPTANILAMAAVLIISVGVPIALMIFARVKFKARFVSFFIGCGVFVVMALILEGLVNRTVFAVTGTLIVQNTLLYALYGGIMAALFEETGRLIAMKFFLKKNLDFANGFMYGVGHGGIESILLVGLTYVSNLIVSLMINAGSFQITLNTMPEGLKQTTIEQLSPLWKAPYTLFLSAGFERVSAIMLQIGMSLIMFYAVKNKKPIFAVVSYLIHFAVDACTVLINSKASVMVTESAIFIMGAATLAFGIYLNRSEEKVSNCSPTITAPATPFIPDDHQNLQ